MDDWAELAELVAGTGSGARSDAAHAAIGTMRSILGDGWLEAGWVAPELALAGSHTIAFAQLLELALRLEQMRDVSGAAVLRRALRDDRTPARWRHTELQLELAALAMAAGATAEFESGRKRGWPADVVLSCASATISVEAFAVFASDNWRTQVRTSDEISERLRGLEFRYRVSIVVDFGGARLSPSELGDWLRQVETTAALVAENGTPLRVAHATVRCQIAPLDLGPPSSFRGPPIYENPWSRIVRKIDQKRQQARASTDRIWLRVDLLDGMWQYSKWGQSHLDEKLAVLSEYLRHEIDGIDQLDGLVVSTGPAFAQGRDARSPILHRDLQSKSAPLARC